MGEWREGAVRRALKGWGGYTGVGMANRVWETGGDGVVVRFRVHGENGR